ncbi:PBP1A family penicillin-binding protein [Oceanobacillus locisalsi]|uniref:PBP1A family penicillin-binding protein n=1 Tax=Oceanobacillus locisalsi TaxID=546107 RepID=A0ABW3NFX3_9BACI
MADQNSQTRAARRKQQGKKTKNKKKQPMWKKVIKIILLLFLILFLGGAAVGAYWIAQAPDIDEEQLNVPFASTLYDKNGEPFTNLSSDEKRQEVNFEELPDLLIDAVTATEDVRFFDHNGIDIRRIGGAIQGNFTGGFGSQGASTITQQVVERAFLSNEKKVSIKVQEMWMAMKLERQYSKEEIMEMYLNTIFYGNHAYGVAQAAETYFGKEDLDDLTLPEAAILAGLPQRPTAYNPIENPELTEERMNTVLNLMVRHGKITEEEAEEAKSVDIPSLLTEERPDPSPYDAFVDQVRKEVNEKLEDVDLDSDGLKVHTTLDPDAQPYVEDVMERSDSSPINYPEDTQGAMVVLDTQSGAIQAIGGSINNESDFNYATRGTTQAGSTAKPIMSYGPAVEYNQMSTYHQLDDEGPYELEGSNPVRNATRSYNGWVTARYALQQSLNVPAVKLMEEVGPENSKEFAENLGFEFDSDYLDLREAIGGTSTEVTPIQMAGAYSAFGNEGNYTEPYAVTKVEFSDGREVDLTPDTEKVMEDYTAYMVTDMLKSVVQSGTGTNANVPDLDMAGKTGTTTMDGQEGSRDAWFVGYTTNYTIASWTGGYQSDGSRVPLQDTTLSQQMFQQTMSQLSEGVETADFNRPDSVVDVEVEKGTNPAALASDSTPSDNKVTELFVEGTEPNEVSERYEELDGVSGLSGSYNEDDNSIEVSWDYDADSDDDVNFDVSASIDGGSMQSLSSTSDTSMDISDVEEGAEYTIQVVAESGSTSSDPATTTVQVPGGDEDEEEQEDIPGVSGLSAEYNGEDTIDVSWSYDGPSANFEVSVNGDTQNVGSESIAVSGVTPGDYDISVTPTSEEDSNVQGPSSSTSVTVPEEEGGDEEEESEEEEQPEEENGSDSESDADTDADSDSESSGEENGNDSDGNEDNNNDNNDNNDSGNENDSSNDTDNSNDSNGDNEGNEPDDTENQEEQESESDDSSDNSGDSEEDSDSSDEGSDDVSPQNEDNGDEDSSPEDEE